MPDIKGGRASRNVKLKPVATSCPSRPSAARRFQSIAAVIGRRARLRVGLAIAIAETTAWSLAAPIAAAHDPECDTIMSVGDQLDAAFDQVEPQGYTPPGTGSRIRDTAAPLYQLSGPTAVDLRNWSDILASKLDHDGRYLQEGSDEVWLSADLGAARSHLLAARQYCLWSYYTLG